MLLNVVETHKIRIQIDHKMWLSVNFMIYSINKIMEKILNISVI